MRFQCYEAIGVAIGEAGNVSGRRPPHRGRALLAVPVSGDPGRHRRVGDGGQPLPPAQDPLLDAHHRVEPGALRAAGGGAQRAAAAGRRLHRRHRPLPARRHPLPERRHPPHLLRGQAAAAQPSPSTSTTWAPRASCASVSTEIDEICERHDTLMHFLRKQSHAESSNRLVAFSRAVLTYWMTLDPAGLEPYLSANTMAAVRGEREWAEGPHEVLLALRAAAGQSRRGARRAGRASGRRSTGRARRSSTALVQLPAPALEAHWRWPSSPATAATDRHGPRGAWPSWCAPTSCSPRSTRCRPTTSGRRSAATCSSTRRSARGSRRPSPPGRTTPAPRHPRPPARRGAHRARGAQGDHPQPAPSDGRRRTSTRSATSRPASRRCTATTASPSSTRWACRSAWRTWSAGCSRTSSPRASSPTSPATPCAAWRPPSGASSGPWPPTASTRATSAPTCGLLEASFSSHNFTFHQYQNVFQFLVQSGHRALARRPSSATTRCCTPCSSTTPGSARRAACRVDAVAEMVLREVLVSALGMQTLDRYVSAALRQISMLTGRLSNHALTRMMNYDPERLVSPIHQAEAGHRRPDDAGLQGAGAQADGRLRAPGAARASSSPPSCSAPCRPCRTGRSTTTRWSASAGAVHRLERQTGLRLGDPARLLTALHPLRRGHLHARAHDHVRRRGPQRRARRGPLAASPASSGPPGTATAASCSPGPWPPASTATSSTPS